MPRRKVHPTGEGLDPAAPCGVRYRVIRPTGYPTDPAIIRRLLAGEGDRMPLETRGMKEVEPGDVVDDIPNCSVAGLLAKGAIERDD